MRYQVFAVQWDSKSKMQQEFLIGEFTSYMNAKLFRDAYSAHYSATALIKEIRVS